MQRFTTVNEHIFVLNIFTHYSRFSNAPKNMYKLKITCLMPHSGNDIKNANLSPRKIANFCKFAIIHRRENINVRSI